MDNPVSSRRDGAIAIIIVDNPPVNALKHAVRAGIRDAFVAARDDVQVEAIVLTGAGRTFMAGADITEFGKTSQPPSLIDVIALIDAIAKPTIAAAHGTPLGGGLELTLACHFRVAAPGTRLGLPEIKLGLIPGAGGTQRLPRLVGIDKALGMILSGDPIAAKDALAVGLIDEIIDGDLVAGAVAFARRVLAEKRPLRRVRDMEDKLAEARRNPEKFGEIVAAHAKRSRGLAAPAAAIEAVRWTLDVPIDDALRRERDTFMQLLAGDQSKAQRHVFFAEREAAKIPGVPKDVAPRAIERAAVIGAGTMGGGIAMCFANAGIPVTLIETGADALKRGQDTIARNYKTSVSRGSLGADEMERRLARFNGTTDIAAVADADIVIEAVFEEMDIKKQVFGNLDRLAKAGAVLATNTSYLDVNAIAQITKRPASVLGTHFFSPANVMRLLEIVRGTETAPEVLATAIAVGRRLGKVPVVVGVCHGFVGNRMLSARGIEAERLLLEGALPQQVDGALAEFGFPMGPFAMSDLAGLDVSWRNRKERGVKAVIADAICENGDFGQKTGKGYYVYEAGARAGRPNPDVEALVVDASARLGIKRRAIDKAEIIERLIYPMINEGARILEEGIALRPGDIDVIWIYGYGFPVWRGGPMFYADTIGLAVVRDRLAELARTTGDKRHTPAPLLERLANDGATFGSLAGGKA
ncbi:MAG TPA: 3-hydroxyacyl-CoA dehydrogenase NAD-binding domain-containing protein [Xanthobacteraceae bacterium]